MCVFFCCFLCSVQYVAALVGAIAVVFGMKDSRLYDVSSGGSDESSSKTAKKKR